MRAANSSLEFLTKEGEWGSRSSQIVRAKNSTLFSHAYRVLAAFFTEKWSGLLIKSVRAIYAVKGL